MSRALLATLVGLCALGPGAAWAQPAPPPDPEPPAEKPAEKPPEKPAEKPPEKPAEKPAQKPQEKPAEKPAPEQNGFSLNGARASFPLLDGKPFVVEAHLSVFAQYFLSLRSESEETQWFHAFELPRGHIELDASFEGARARVLAEAVRSATDGALLGVAGDSLLFRLREAWAQYTAFHAVEVTAGLVPTLSIGPIESLWGMRMIAPTGLERTGLASPADLGATARGLFPKGFGWIGAGAYNGEGYAQRELNRGKNVEVAALVHPFAVIKAVQPLTVHASYSAGSSGTALARSDRVNASIGWEGDVLRGGFSFAYAWGLDGDGDRRSALFEAFLRVRPIPRLSLGAEGVVWLRDMPATDDYLATITGAIGYFIVDPLGVFVAVDGQLFGAPTEQQIPSLDDVRFRVIGAVQF